MCINDYISAYVSPVLQQKQGVPLHGTYSRKSLKNARTIQYLPHDFVLGNNNDNDNNDNNNNNNHDNDAIMSAMASKITGVSIVCTTVASGTDQRKHPSFASLVFVRWPVNSSHKWPVTRKMVPFDVVIMILLLLMLLTMMTTTTTTTVYFPTNYKSNTYITA